jgi:hypothetical protein
VRGSELCIVAAVLVSAKPMGASKKKLAKRPEREKVTCPCEGGEQRAGVLLSNAKPNTVGVIGPGIMGPAMSANSSRRAVVQGYDSSPHAATISRKPAAPRFPR